MNQHLSSSLTSLLVLLSLVQIPGRAQSPWAGYDSQRNISVELLTTQFKSRSNYEYGFLNGGYFLSCRIPVSQDLRFIGELPIGNYSVSAVTFLGTASATETAVGNPFLGLETIGSSGLSGEFGLRLPIRSEDNDAAHLTGVLSDWQRMEAFSYKILPLKGMLHYRNSRENMLYAIRGGASLLFDVSGDRKDAAEIYLLYDGRIGYDGERARALVGLSGILWLTNDSDLEDRVFHTIDLNAAFKLQSIVLGLLVKFPLNKNYSDVVGSVVGVTAEFGI